MRCYKCGAKEGSIAFIGAVCINCYEIKCRIPKIELEQCVRCHKIKIKGGWQKYREEVIEEYILERCKGEDAPSYVDFDNKEVVFNIKEREIRKKIDVSIKNVVCPTCSKISGGYYEAIIQLRGKKSKIIYYLKKLVRELEKETFIAKIEELKEGIDVYVGNTKAVFQLLSSLSLSYKMSRKLHGMKEGKRMYRTTFLLRF